MTYRSGLRHPVVEMTSGETYANSSEIPVYIDTNPVQESDEQSMTEYYGIEDLVERAESAVYYTDEAQEVEVPLYMVTRGSDTSVALSNYKTYVANDDTASLAVSLPEPNEGNDYVCGVIFKAITDFTFSVTPPSGYSIVWDGTPVWKANKIYELVFAACG